MTCQGNVQNNDFLLNLFSISNTIILDLSYWFVSSLKGKPDGDAAYDYPYKKFLETSEGLVEAEKIRFCGFFNLRKDLYINEPKKNRKPGSDGRNYNKQGMVLDLVDYLPPDTEIVPSKLVSGKMVELVNSMNGRKFVNDDGKLSSMKMTKGYEITATHKDEDLKPVDHYLLDEDAVKLAWKTWDEEILGGSFFVIEGLLEQWFDLSYRSRDEIFDLFTAVCKDEFDADVDEGMEYQTHKKMSQSSTYVP